MADETTQSSDPIEYPSLVEEGHVMVEIPEMQNLTQDGPYPNSDMRTLTKMERIQVRSFPSHVCQRVETAFKRQGPAAACATLSHYCQHGKEILLEPDAARQLRALTEEMGKSNNPESFFQTKVRPWLLRLTPHARER
jgi:hypothetical protein